MVQIVIPDILNSRNICAICRREVHEEGNLIICPFCISAYHRKHLAEWVERKNSCPVCKKGLKEYNLGIPLEKIRPKPTQRSRYRKSHIISQENRHNYARSDITSRSRQNSNFHRINSENHDHTKELKLIAALVIFWLMIFSTNVTLALVGSIVIVPLIFYFFNRWYNSYHLL